MTTDLPQDEEGILSPLLQRRRIKAALPWLRGRTLDFGCGSGALAGYVPSSSYVGVDSDRAAIVRARELFPDHEFGSSPDPTDTFDTIVALAVIEHLTDPASWFNWARSRLSGDGRIVVTTPEPRLEAIHAAGARIGVFSAHAHDQHVSVMGSRDLASLGELVSYRRFLLGANQLAVFTRRV